MGGAPLQPAIVSVHVCASQAFVLLLWSLFVLELNLHMPVSPLALEVWLVKK
jgi:hypothetical protein